MQMRTRFCEAILRERIRKTETNFLKSFLVWVSAPQEGAGGMRGGFFLDFLVGRALRKETTNIEISAKPRHKF